MKGLKKLFSVVLGIFMFVTSMPNVFAAKRVENALVIGTEESQRKFTRILFGEEKMLETYYVVNCDKENDIKLAVTLDYRSHSQKIASYIENGQIGNFYSGRFAFKGIVATVDADQEMDKVKEDMKNILDFICDHKPDYTQILIVGCTDRKNIDSRDNFFNKLANYTGWLEYLGTENGWGSKQDRDFFDSGQFLGFLTFDMSRKEELKSMISKFSYYYDYYRQNSVSKKFSGTMCDFVNNHKVEIAIGATSLVAAGVCVCLAKKIVFKD